MNNKHGVSINTLTTCFIVICTIMPIAAIIISTYLTTYSYFFVIALMFLSIVLSDGRNSFNEYCGGLLLPFIIYQILQIFVSQTSITMWAYSALLRLLPIVLGYSTIYYCTSDAKKVLKTIICAMVITSATTWYGLIKYPLASRFLATMNTSDAMFTVYSWMNIGSYSFIYLVVLLYPIIIMEFKKNRISFLTTLGLTVLCFGVVIKSQYTTALLLLMLSSILFFAKRDLKKKDIILLMITLVSFFFLSGYLSGFLRFIASLTGSEILSERLNSLAGGGAGLKSSESNRIELYQISINTFLSHPIFGTFFSGGYGIGGHSFILDTLARYGVVGACTLYCMYRKLYKIFILPFQGVEGYGYIVWIYLQAILLSTINTGMWTEVIAFYLPVIVYRTYGFGDIRNEDTVDY